MGAVSHDAQMRGNARFGAPCTANPPEPEIVFGLPGDELVFLIERYPEPLKPKRRAISCRKPLIAPPTSCKSLLETRSIEGIWFA